MAAHHMGEWQLLSTISTTISLGTCSPRDPICVASRTIQHATFSEFALKIRTSSLRRIPGGVHSAQEGTWAVKLTCTSHAQSRHHWLIRSSQSSAFASRVLVVQNTKKGTTLIAVITINVVKTVVKYGGAPPDPHVSTVTHGGPGRPPFWRTPVSPVRGLAR
jgi:hypothetical protein